MGLVVEGHHLTTCTPVDLGHVVAGVEPSSSWVDAAVLSHVVLNV